MDEKLKLCPFCGSKDLRIFHPVDPYGIEYIAVCCYSCGGSGAPSLIKNAAIEDWNRRAAGWIKTNERLPELHIPVIIYNPEKAEEDEQLTLGRCYKEDKRPVYYWTRARGFPVATEVYPYWMPLPEPPEVEE